MSFDDNLKRLLVVEPEAFFRATISVVAPTHVAKSALAANFQKFDPTLPLEVETVHSAFHQPKFHPRVQEAAELLHSTYKSPTAVVLTDSERDALFERVAVLLRTNSGKRLSERQIGQLVATYTAKPSANLADGFESVGLSALDFVDSWVPKPAASTFLSVLDEGSMTLKEMGETVKRSCKTLVVMGDRAQLKPVVAKTLNGKEQEVLSAMDLMANHDAALFELYNNHRAGADAKNLHQFLLGARGLALEAAGNCSGQQLCDLFKHLWTDAKNLSSGGGGVVFKERLSDQDIFEIAASNESIGIVWKNDDRVALNDQIRGLIGLRYPSLKCGEKVVVLQAMRAANEQLIKQTQTSNLWRVRTGPNWLELDEDGHDEYHGFAPGARFDIGANTPEVEQLTANTHFCFSDFENPLYSAFGPWQTAGVRLTFGYFVTCHKSQSRQWDKVYIHRKSLEEKVRMDLRYGRTEWINWIYTAASRAKKQVVFFSQLPDQIEAATRDQIAEAHEAFRVNDTSVEEEIAKTELSRIINLMRGGHHGV